MYQNLSSTWRFFVPLCYFKDNINLLHKWEFKFSIWEFSHFYFICATFWTYLFVTWQKPLILSGFKQGLDKNSKFGIFHFLEVSCAETHNFWQKLHKVLSIYNRKVRFWCIKRLLMLYNFHFNDFLGKCTGKPKKRSKVGTFKINTLYVLVTYLSYW